MNYISTQIFCSILCEGKKTDTYFTTAYTADKQTIQKVDIRLPVSAKMGREQNLASTTLSYK